MVESVVWACERKDVLCVLFYLLSLLCYVSYVSAPLQEKRLRYAVALLMFLCALLSKPMAVTLPVILLLLDFYPLSRITLATTKNLWVLWEKIPFLILSLITGIITTLAQAEKATTSLEYLPLSARLLNALRSLVFYLHPMIIPSDLIPFYPYPLNIYVYDARYIIAGIVVLLISGGCFWMARKKRHLFFAVWTYYVLTLLPVLGIVQVGQQAAADRDFFSTYSRLFLDFFSTFSTFLFRKMVCSDHLLSGVIYG